MRILVAAIFVLVAALPVAGQDWRAYFNQRFGYEGPVPPGFSGYAEADNGDGRIYDLPSRQQSLAYWGNVLAEESFEAEAQASIGYAERDGWGVDYRAITPHWAEFSGRNGDRHFYRRMIALCDGASVASATFQWSARHAGPAQDVIARLQTLFTTSDC